AEANGWVMPPFTKENRPVSRSNQAEMDRFKAMLAADPEGAKKIIESVLSKKFMPHDGQKPVMESNARFKVMCAGRRFGKTKIAAALGHKKARRESKMVWWVAPTYKVVKRGYAEVLRQLPKGVLTQPPP